MKKETREKYIEAGKAIQKARKHAREISEPGTNLKQIAESIEELIRGEGLQPAFPVNLSINEQAAHYTPSKDENRELKADDVLKIDIGAHSDGYIADTALTVNPSGEHRDIIDAVEKVLEAALEFIEPGKTVGEFGTFVEKQVPEEYNIVQNLTGHYLGHYKQHAGVSIPNSHNQNSHTFEKGDAVAIEPFLSTGTGMMKNGAEGNIYKIENDRNVRDRTARKLMKQIRKFNGLPFTPRWLDNFGARKQMALKQLVQKDVIHSYPILRDRDGSVVAQAEHTVLIGVDDGKNIITTRN